MHRANELDLPPNGIIVQFSATYTRAILGHDDKAAELLGSFAELDDPGFSLSPRRSQPMPQATGVTLSRQHVHPEDTSRSCEMRDEQGGSPARTGGRGRWSRALRTAGRASRVRAAPCIRSGAGMTRGVGTAHSARDLQTPYVRHAPGVALVIESRHACHRRRALSRYCRWPPGPGRHSGDDPPSRPAFSVACERR